MVNGKGLDLRRPPQKAVILHLVLGAAVDAYTVAGKMRCLAGQASRTVKRQLLLAISVQAAKNVKQEYGKKNILVHYRAICAKIVQEERTKMRNIA